MPLFLTSFSCGKQETLAIICTASLASPEGERSVFVLAVLYTRAVYLYIAASQFFHAVFVFYNTDASLATMEFIPGR